MNACRLPGSVAGLWANLILDPAIRLVIGALAKNLDGWHSYLKGKPVPPGKYRTARSCWIIVIEEAGRGNQ